MPVFHLIFAESSRGLFLLLSPKLLAASDSLMFSDWRLGAGNHLIIPPDDFVTIIQVMGFAPEVRSGVGHHVYISSYLAIIDLIIVQIYISAKWHCIKWDKHFWSMKYFCLPQFDTITLICYSCRDCSSEMIDINWIHIQHGFCAQYSVRNYKIMATPALHACALHSSEGVSVQVSLNLWARRRTVLQDFMPNYTRS